jgi:hypothetical protein
VFPHPAIAPAQAASPAAAAIRTALKPPRRFPIPAAFARSECKTSPASQLVLTVPKA